MKMLIKNIHSGNIDFISACLAQAGWVGCNEHIDIDCQMIDFDYRDLSLVSMAEFESMLEMLLDNGFKVEFEQ